MKKILFPTEFSNHATEAFKYAVEIAFFFQARLIVMHALGKPDSKLGTDGVLEKIIDRSTDKMIEFVQGNLPELYNKVQIDYIAKTGLPGTSILEVALDEGADLIVMGMTGKTDAIETIFGSTALEILTKADCPVLTIPSSAKFEGIDNLVYTTNFEFRDLEAINYLQKWSKAFDAPIHCLHVVESDESEMIVAKNMNTLKQTYTGRNLLKFDMVKGDFQDQIERFAKAKKADIVAMMSHKRSFIARLIEKSAVKGIARRISIPVLVMKDNAYELNEGVAEWITLANSIA